MTGEFKVCDDSSCWSLVLEEASELCGNMYDLSKSAHAVGAWADGMAVQQLFMKQFGNIEGEDAVEEHMQHLGVEVSTRRKPIMELALTILIGNRCEIDDVERL